MPDLRTELSSQIDQAEWDWLIPHAQRDALVVVVPELDLVEVGIALANDNAAVVQQWIQRHLIFKPSPEQISQWNSDRQKRFNALIVQPYVLMQELPLAA